ncbi:MAG TPA: SDR family oxidoreductase [Solirubrobacterales bacterium]|nr:SDR family oxidoreductase [Solirubrobacterales bacterium]
MAEKTVLIVGASGVVGSAAVEHFLHSDAGWKVVAVSRRQPLVVSDRDFRHLAVDLRAPEASRAALGELTGVTHVVYAALFEKPGLAAGWNDDDYRQINAGMLRNVLEPLIREARAPLEHVSLLQGAKAYGFHLGPMETPARERQPRQQHENFYWDQEDYVRDLASSEGCSWTVLRPHLITGGSPGVAMNLPPVIGVYAAVCRQRGLEFGFPGGPAAPWESTDSRVVASALEWCALDPAARNETFNVTNGEVFGWRDLWPAIADALGLEPGGDTPHELGTFLPEAADEWREIAARHDLVEPDVNRVLGESHYLADLVFAHGMSEMPPAAFESTVKIRRAGFADCMDTEEMWSYWLGRLIEARVIPGRDA